MTVTTGNSGTAVAKSTNAPVAPAVMESLSVDELKQLAKAPLQLFQRFLGEARTLMTEEGRSRAATLEKLKALRARTLHETEELLQRFRQKVSEEERHLQMIICPPREEFAAQTRRLLRELTQVIERLVLKEQLTRRWDEQLSSALLAEYEAALREGDPHRIEIFEANAEQYLARKGDLQILAQFLALRSRSQEARLTPSQREAQAALAELHRMIQHATVAFSLVASVAQADKGPLLEAATWRQEDRHEIDRLDQLGIAAALSREGQPVLPVMLLDCSKQGLQVEAPEEFLPGTILSLSVKLPGLTEEASPFKGEVRWSREDPNKPGRYLLGLSVIEETEGPWRDLLPAFLHQINAIRALFPSRSR